MHPIQPDYPITPRWLDLSRIDAKPLPATLRHPGEELNEAHTPMTVQERVMAIAQKKQRGDWPDQWSPALGKAKQTLRYNKSSASLKSSASARQRRSDFISHSSGSNSTASIATQTQTGSNSELGSQGIPAIRADRTNASSDSIMSLMKPMGANALHIAASSGRTERVLQLLRSGTNPGEPMADRRTALHIAADAGHADTVAILLEHAPELAQISDMGEQIPLHLAVKNGHSDVVELLLNTQADPNAFDSGGKTALHFAAKQGHATIVRQLLEAPRIRPNAEDNRGLTPLHTAARYGHLDVMALLLGHRNVSINEMDNNGDTALHHAYARGQGEAVKLLLERGANARALNQQLQQPHDAAHSLGQHAHP